MKKAITILFSFFLTQFSFAQFCETPPSPPSELYVSDLSFNQTNATAQFNWTGVDSAYRYVINRKKIEDSDWQIVGALDTIFAQETNRVFGGMEYLTTYVWRMKSFCGTTGQPQSEWSEIDTFATLEFSPAVYSPVFEIELENTDCESESQITFIIAQDANEPDIQSSAVFSSGGYFDIANLSEDEEVGETYVLAGGGFYENNYTLIVNEVIDNNKTIIALENNYTQVIDGYFTIENENEGIKLINVSPNDGNSYTSGTFSEITFYNLFVNPSPGVLEFYVTIPSELGDLYSDQIDFNIDCTSIEEFQLADIYPNPTEGPLTIEVVGKKVITLLNIMGQKVFEVTTSKQHLQLPRLTSGVYFLEVTSDSKKYRNRLIFR